MPVKLAAKWSLEYDRRGPTVSQGWGAGLPRVEGSGEAVITALTSGIGSIPGAALANAEAVVRQYTEEHRVKAEATANSIFGRKRTPTGKGIRDNFSTEYQKGPSFVRGVSKNTARHAIFQELGFWHYQENVGYVGPNPFMFNTFAALRDGFVSAVTRIFG